MCFFFSSRRRHTRCALVTGVQTCALPILRAGLVDLHPGLAPRGLLVEEQLSAVAGVHRIAQIEAAAVAERAAGLVAQEPACVPAIETVAGQPMHAVYPGVPAPARVLVADAVGPAFDTVVYRPPASRRPTAQGGAAVLVPVSPPRGREPHPPPGA